MDCRWLPQLPQSEGGEPMTCDCKTKCNPCRCGKGEGERRKADALATLAERRDVYVNRARRALLRGVLDTGTATIDQVRGIIELPEGLDPKLFGTVPGALARAGIIRAAGFVKTSRPEGHGRPVTRWELADRLAAERWLQTHPEVFEPNGELPEPITDRPASCPERAWLF